MKIESLEEKALQIESYAKLYFIKPRDLFLKKKVLLKIIQLIDEVNESIKEEKREVRVRAKKQSL